MDRMDQLESTPEPPKFRRKSKVGVAKSCGRKARWLQAIRLGTLSWLCCEHGDQSERAGGPSLAVASGRRVGSRFAAPPVFEALVDSYGDGRVDPGRRLFQHCQPAAGPGREPASRDRSSTQSGSRPFPHHPSIAAFQATRVDITPALKETRASESHGRVRRFGLRFGFRFGMSHVLVVAQIGTSLLLVVAAGLFVRTVTNLHSVNLGFNAENVLIFTLDATQAGYKEGDCQRR
jgi:hypothetical protein